MIVTPIASTRLDMTPASVLDTNFGMRVEEDLTMNEVQDIDALGEFAGRACYQAWSLPNPGTHENEDYLANIQRQGHFSVLEHGSVTFYVEGVSRSLTHELERHRHLSYSELSQRYVDMADIDIVIPPIFRDDPEAVAILQDVLAFSKEAYGQLVEIAESKGAKRKEQRQAARYALPNVETRLVVTGNLRAWRDMLSKRWHVAADAEIREFAGEVLKHLRHIAPHSVQDIPEAPFQ